MVRFGRRLALGLSSILADSGALFLCPLNEGAGEYAGTMLLVLPWLSSAFFRLFCGFFVTANAVIDVTVRKMVTNIPPLHIFQKEKKIIRIHATNLEIFKE
jgi:hypothetical protein